MKSAKRYICLYSNAIGGSQILHYSFTASSRPSYSVCLSCARTTDRQAGQVFKTFGRSETENEADHGNHFALLPPSGRQEGSSLSLSGLYRRFGFNHDRRSCATCGG